MHLFPLGLLPLEKEKNFIEMHPKYLLFLLHDDLSGYKFRTMWCLQFPLCTDSSIHPSSD